MSRSPESANLFVRDPVLAAFPVSVATLHNCFRAARMYPAEDWVDSLSKGQLLSKAWLIRELNRCFRKSSGSFALSSRVWIVGGWYGILGAMLLDSAEFEIDWIRSLDIDPRCEAVADEVNRHAVIDDWRFKAITGDMKTVDYSPADLIINTSCEHLDDFPGWFSAIPAGKRVVLQSNDQADVAGHLGCVGSIEEFQRSVSLSRVDFAGALDCGGYRRYMIIGVK